MSNPRLSSAQRPSAGRAFVQRLGAVTKGIGKWLARNPRSTLLLVASVALLITFFSLLGSLGPQGHGQEV